MRVSSVVAMSLLMLTGCVVRVASPPPPPPARHPAYLQAVEDLRVARAHLARPAMVTAQTAWDEEAAMRSIDGAINEAVAAAADDGKRLVAPPRVDLPPDWAGRLQRALELLERARGNLNHPEDNGVALPPRNRALALTDEAIGFVRQGIAANRVPVVAPPPPQPVVVPAPPPPAPVVVVLPAHHPAYLRAMEDLRAARAHLQRPAAVTRVAAWDEAVAIGAVDNALKELSRAALDSGQNPAARPPVDLPPDWAGRLHRSAELLERARRDVAQPEHNPDAQAWQRRALGHIDEALAFVRQGISANGGR